MAGLEANMRGNAEVLQLSEFPPPFRFVAGCLASLLTPDRNPGRLLMPHEFEALDWPAVTTVAARHRVETAVACALRRRDWSQVPTEVREGLEHAEKGWVAQGLAQIAETERIATAFGEEAIRFFILKGSPLSTQLFGSRTFRQSRDIDLIVDPEDFPPAAELLRRLGYDSSRPASDSCALPHGWMQRQIHYEANLRHRVTGRIVELHWQPMDHGLLPFSVADLWSSRAVVRMHRLELPVLPDGALLTYLACHGAKHAWYRLKWLLDIAALLSRSDASFVATVWNEAEYRGLGAVVGSGLILSCELFGLPLEEALIERARRNRRARRLARYASRALALTDIPLDSPLLFLNRLNLRTEPRYRLSVLAKVPYRLRDWRRLPGRLPGQRAKRGAN